MPDPPSPSPPEGLERISASTIAHYERVAGVYRDATKDHDVSQNVHVLLGAIAGAPPYRILDLGCGPGRDLVTFRALGHEPVGLDGCAAFVAMARGTGCEVWQQDILAMDLPPAAFDGVFANATLFHVPSAALPGVMRELRATLRPGGVLLCSNPRGTGEEGWVDERYACFYDFATWRDLVSGTGFTLIDHYYRPPGLPRRRQPWLATLWRAGPEAAQQPGRRGSRG